MSSKLSIDQSVTESQLDHINTQIIHPISINQQSATIIIPNRGGSLDKNTCIVLPAIVNSNSVFYPIGTGVAALLNSVSLLANGKVIAQNTNPGNYITMSNSFQQQEYRERVLLPRTGCKEQYGPSSTGTQYIAGANPADFLITPGKIGLKDLEYERVAGVQNAVWANNVNSFGDVNVPGIRNNNYNLSTDKTTTAQYYLYLEQLFPKLYGGLQLPTYLIEAELSLVIRFSSNNGKYNLNERVLDDSDRVITASQIVPQSNTEISCQIVTEEVVLLTDYLVPTPDAKNKLMQQVMSNEGLVLQYGDLLFNNFFMEGLPAASVNTGIRNFKRYNFQLGMSNKVVRQMYLMFNPTQNNRLTGGDSPYTEAAAPDATTKFGYSGYNQINALKGKYASRALSYLHDGERIQINFNSKNVFNTPLESSGHKLHELQTAYGSSFCMPVSSYDFKDIVVDSVDNELTNYAGNLGRLLYQKSILAQRASCQGWSPQNLAGSAHVIGVNFQRPVLTPDNRLIRVNLSGSGQRCSSVPIEIQIDRLCNRGEGSDNRDMVCCMCVEKTMKLQGGQIFIDED